MPAIAARKSVEIDPIIEENRPARALGAMSRRLTSD